MRSLGSQPLLVVDGNCVMCSAWAAFILRFDRTRRVRLATTQSQLGSSLYQVHELDPNTTNLLIVGDDVFVRSDAVIGVLVEMGWPWRMAAAARLLPRRWRDAAYDWVARHRLHLFGRRETCLTPSPADRERFVS
ncbi:MAG: DCC1-like thiol-disulfide oxidoreductase family protein [Sphingomonadaceae bacterium]|nr:DCC1-like thiol-disulfide oxidoreductase family protein [Sphingomonadaceae bacterium]